MNKIIYGLSIALLFAFQQILPQQKDSLVIYYYNKGIEALTKNDLETAKDFFKNSIMEKENAAAEFGLAKAYRLQKSHGFLNLSRDHIKIAVALDAKNIEYRLFYASISLELYNASKLELFAWEDAVKQYTKAIEIDSSNVYALQGLWQLKIEDYNKQHLAAYLNSNYDSATYHALKRLYNSNSLDINSIGKIRAEQNYDLFSAGPIQKAGNYAQDDFYQAEKALLTSIKFNPTFPDAYYELALLYEENNNYADGIYYLKKYTLLKPDDAKGHAYLGLLYYEASKMDSSYMEYENAFELMSTEEKEDYTFNSTKIILASRLGDKMKSYSENTLKQLINVYWKARDPLYLSEYNVRLLEHYSRIAYSNLWFGIPHKDVPGWKTDRGNIMLRYGFPTSRLLLKGGIRDLSSQESKNNIKTELWTYPDKTFAFTDEFQNGNYQLAQRGKSQYWDDSQDFAEELKRTQPEEYNPKFEGPVFNVPFNIVEFKNPDRQGLTDLYVNYGIKINKDSVNGAAINIKHNAGLSFLDKYYNKIAAVQATISSLHKNKMIIVPDSGTFLMHSLSISAKPDSGTFSFELLNDSDKGVASYHFGFKMETFNYTNLDISDLLLASNISNNSKNIGTINRKSFSILPHPVNIFGSGSVPYIYYELYNLKTDSACHTNFTQEVVLQDAESKEKGFSIGKVIGSVVKFLSKGSAETNVGISSNYQTEGKDAQMYFQIDMNGYRPADYILTVNVKDNLTGLEVSKSTKIKWK